MQTLLSAFLVSALVAMLLLRHQRLHLPYSADLPDQPDRQRYHTGAVPRIGGVAIGFGILTALTWSAWRGLIAWPLAGLLLVAALPAFVAGLMEDITKRVSALARLLATLASGALAVELLDVHLNRVDLPGLDGLLGWFGFSAGLTVLAMAGMANAINIIDGFHGLSAAVAAMMAAALAYVAWTVGDTWVLQIAMALIGALAGFFLWNYPRGLIFMGDGGAYLVGFLLALCGVSLVQRNPQVSPWFVLLTFGYPVTETLFSIYRKALVRAQSPAVPDGLHLHMLVYRRMLRWAAGGAAARDITRRNAATSPYLWGLCSLAIIPALLWWQSSLALQISAAAYAALYIYVYLRVVRFKVPGPLRRRVGGRHRR